MSGSVANATIFSKGIVIPEFVFGIHGIGGIGGIGGILGALLTNVFNT